ncbi:carbohydrate ABC transporter permease [Klebsiella sp. BIGb0407]|uniref:carbohydrate ABC transporter permease n=1 Tax=Klebsiella sp. BIGb0407 TaxID=2940603 RepID=UPI0021690B3C|nr:carbohydrate ABC transporter permease [Klebsiella sp. BIGb0407]MCS3431295.1 multiple sugar transport system permease protein [Klebsiella sp. BIGb0407]
MLRSSPGRDRLYIVSRGAVIILYAAIVLFPFLWLLSTAFKKQIDILLARFIFTPTLDTLHELLFDPSSMFSTYFINSVVITLATTAVIVVVTLLSAYALTTVRQLPAALGAILLGWCLLFNLLPAITFVGSWFNLFRQLGLYDTRIAIIIASIAAWLPMALWLGVTFARELPKELLDAATVDGCTHWQRFRYVFVPLIKSGMTATTILVLLFVWNDFPIALILSSEQARTLPVYITAFSQNEQIRYAEMASSSLLVSLPVLLLLIVGQRFIVKGLLSGAVK